ncbi:hypothetical protein WA026_003560 [Henosepilachna vigintioctopunctata]|uniref:CCHC-type domain-containing protein n=1 Tax=Henosepilachna vigintioctopunctata TaxID=420089 RepID=A0AAW1THP2_9CUCU
MSNSEANFVDNPCGSSGLDTSDHENCLTIPGSLVEEVNLEENIIPRKRSKSPEDVNFSYKGEGKYSTNSKRQKGNVSTSLSDMPRVRKHRQCQTPLTSSALPQSRHELRSNQNLELLVPNNSEMTASTSRNYINLDSPSTSHNSNQKSAVNSRSRKKRSMKRKKPSIETNTEETVEATQKKEEDNFEEELTCMEKNNATCPICRQIISSQNSTLVLDKCVERVLQTSDEEKKEYRKNLIAYRQANTDETLLHDVPNNGPVNNNINGTANNNQAPVVFSEDNGWPIADDTSSVDDYEFFGANVDFTDDEFLDPNVFNYELHDMYYVNHSSLSNDVDENNDEEYQNENDIDDSLDVYDGYEESSPSENNSESENEYDEGSECTDEEAEYESQLEEEEEEIEGDEESSCEEYDDEEDNESSGTSIDRVICYNCGVAGHFARQCPKRVAYTGRRGGYYGGYGTCFRCNMEGHWANGCPN